MEANLDHLHTPYNEKETIDSIINRLNKCSDFTVEICKLATDTHIVRIVYGLIDVTRQYSEDCQAWHVVKDKMWTTFQDHFYQSI